MKTIHYMSIISCGILGLTACGGGGSSSSEAAPAPVVAAPPEKSQQQPQQAESAPAKESTPELPQSPITLQELQVDEAFDFSNQAEVIIQVRHSGSVGKTHFNLCSHWLDESKQSIDYSSCFWRGELTKPESQIQVTVPAHRTQLIAELWQVETGQFQVTRLSAPVQPNVEFLF